jgi:hypothetical protein
MGNLSSLVDMNLATLSNNNNSDIDNKCNEIVRLLSIDENKAINILFELFNDFTKKYTFDNLQDNQYFHFRKDGKTIFLLFQKIFDNDELREEIKKDGEIDELNEYEKFISNLKYIINNIETVDLNGESYFKKSCETCKEYLNKKINDMNELNNALEKLNNSLENLANKLENSIN